MNNQVSIPIGDTSRLITEGIIEGATTRPCAPPQEMQSAFLLPAGEVMNVNPGDAFMVKSGDNQWGRLQFYRPGKMTGPVVYSKVEAETPESAYRNSIAWRFILATNLYFTLAGLVLIAIHPALIIFGGMPFTGFADAAAMTAMICVGFCFIAAFAPSLRKHLRAIRRGGEYAIDALYDTQDIPTLRLPLARIPSKAMTDRQAGHQIRAMHTQRLARDSGPAHLVRIGENAL